jgi:hypothetical protein
MKDSKNWIIALLVLLLIVSGWICSRKEVSLSSIQTSIQTDTIKPQTVVVRDTFVSVIHAAPQVVFKLDTQYILARDRAREDSLIAVLAEAYKINDELIAAMTVTTQSVIHDTIIMYADSIWSYRDDWLELSVNPISQAFTAFSKDELTGIWSKNEQGEVIVTLSGSSPYATYSASAFALPKRYVRPNLRVAAFAGPAYTTEGKFTFATGVSLTYGLDLRSKKGALLARFLESLQGDGNEPGI